MKPIFYLTLAAATLALSGAASAQGWSGNVEAGLFSTDRTSTDTTIVGSPFTGVYLAFQGQQETGAGRFSFDGRFELIDDNGLNDTYESGPVHSGVLGLHYGQDFGATYVGAFAALGYFDGYDDDVNPMQGTLFGLEASHTLAAGTTLYGQLGRMNAIGDPGDNEYVGYAARLGAMHDFTDQIHAGVSYEFGRSEDCFVDCGDQPGEFSMLAIDASYALTDTVSIVGRYSITEIYDEDDDDTGTDNSLFLGARMSFGAQPQSRALTTPMGGFVAAGWMEPLD